MKVFEVSNVNQAVATVIPYLLQHGVLEESRNGRVLVAPVPVVTVYHNPQERVLFGATRAANPFFHLMESLWMLAGRNDLAFPRYFNKNFASYSDDGEKVHGAYGWRWRKSFGYDQLAIIAEELKKNPTSRRCVLSMWDASEYESGSDAVGCNDLILAMSGGKDVPCNTAAYFDVRGGALNMTVCNRSNDAIWGAYGANAVHFSVMQEYLAAWIGVPVGVYRQVSNNFHAYLDVYDEAKLAQIAQEAHDCDYYRPHMVRDKYVYPQGLLLDSTETIEMFDFDLQLFFRTLDSNDFNAGGFHTNFFNNVAIPMYITWWGRKMKMGSGLEQAANISAADWRLACIEWIQRAEDKKHAA
jgi:thymidylate synthase